MREPVMVKAMEWLLKGEHEIIKFHLLYEF